MPERLGLFGGSFDPVHRAHVELARSALTGLALDRVLWIPAGQPWQKARPMTPAMHREAMLRLAIADEPRFVLDRRELERAGPSFTIDTVRELRAEHPDATLFLIIGQDQYAGFHTWQGWPEILQQVVLAVAGRPGAAAAVDPAVRRHRHQVVPLPMQDIAATDIRARVAAGLPIDHLVPPGVARYIDLQGLYRARPRS
jgi:nicotinate-nucleotide adenylyltransferase